MPNLSAYWPTRFFSDKTCSSWQMSSGTRSGRFFFFGIHVQSLLVHPLHKTHQSPPRFSGGRQFSDLPRSQYIGFMRDRCQRLPGPQQAFSRCIDRAKKKSGQRSRTLAIIAWQDPESPQQAPEKLHNTPLKTPTNIKLVSILSDSDRIETGVDFCWVHEKTRTTRWQAARVG